MVVWESQSQTWRLICYHLPLLGGDNLLAPGSRQLPHQISWHMIMIIKIPCHLVLGERLLITACKRIKVISKSDAPSILLQNNWILTKPCKRCSPIICTTTLSNTHYVNRKYCIRSLICISCCTGLLTCLSSPITSLTTAEVAAR